MNQILEKDITFIITTYKSEKLIERCLESLPKESKKIIVENSSNHKLKTFLEKKYDTISTEVLSEYLRMVKLI